MVGVDRRNQAELIDWYLKSRLALLPLHGVFDGKCTCRNDDCRSQGKHPITEKGLLDASNDRDTVRKWYRQYPGCNWGGRPPSGTFVLDVDLRNNGTQNLDVLERQHEELPETLWAITGGGGMHLWFRLSGTLRGKLCKGVDIKSAASGYVVLPPSLHESGAYYSWYHTGVVAQAPWWLAKMLLPRISDKKDLNVPAEGDVKTLVDWLLTQEEGNRNMALFWAASEARDSHYDPNPLVEAAVAIGLPRMEAERTVQSAFSRK